MLLAGCVVTRVPDPHEAATSRFAEWKVKSPLPRIATLRRAPARPEGTVLALRAPRECVVSPAGPLVRTPELDRNLAWLDHAARVLGATIVVLPTPLEVTPGARSRDLLHAYADALPRAEGRIWVWAPSGPWEPDTQQLLAERLRFVCAFEPLRAPRPPGAIAYGRLHGLGVESRLSAAALERVIAAMEPDRGSAYLAVDGPHAIRHAALLQNMADTRVDTDDAPA